MTETTTGRRGRPRLTSLPYVPLDPHLETHPRTLALVDALADHTALPASLVPLIVVRIFSHAGAQAIDGNLGHMSDGVLRRRFAPEFQLPPGVLREALVDPHMGFLVAADDGLHIHDWADGGGQLLEKRRAWNEKKQTKTKGSIFPDLSRGIIENSRPKGKGKGKGKQSIPPTPQAPEANADAEPPPAQVPGPDCLIGDSDSANEGPPPGPESSPVARTEPAPSATLGQPPNAPQSPSQPEPGASPMGALDLASLPDYAELRGAQVEQALSEAGLMAHVGMGAPGMGRLLELLPIRAWELRRAIAAAEAKGGGRAMRSPAGYLASVIRGLRESGEAPPPRATEPPQARQPQGPRETIQRDLARHRAAWARAVAEAGYPPDERRVDRWVDSGAPREEDIALLCEHRGDWRSYDAAVGAERSAALEAIALALAV